jgi:phosphate acyltransferase
MNIGIDTMGGDFAPLEAIKGIQQYLTETLDPAHIFLIGDEAQIKPLVAQYHLPEPHFTIVHAPEVIGMHEHPTKALKEKTGSSIAYWHARAPH